MASRIITQYNRTAEIGVDLTQAIVTSVIVDLKGDPSQQHKIYGLDFGLTLTANADRANFISAALFGILDFQGDINAPNPTIVYTQASNFGQLFYEMMITSQQEMQQAIDFSNPLIINGDRRITFNFGSVGGTGAFTANLFFYLTVRGELTQISDQDKPRLGQYTMR